MNDDYKVTNMHKMKHEEVINSPEFFGLQNRHAALLAAAREVVDCHSISEWIDKDGKSQGTFWGPSEEIPAYDVESEYKRDVAIHALAAFLPEPDR